MWVLLWLRSMGSAAVIPRSVTYCLLLKRSFTPKHHFQADQLWQLGKERCSCHWGLSYHTASCVFCVVDTGWGDKLSLCTLRAKSKEWFAGPSSSCLLGERQGIFQVLFILLPLTERYSLCMQEEGMPTSQLPVSSTRSLAASNR